MGKTREVPPPLELSKQILARDQWPGVPPLRGLAEAPVMVPGGRVLTRSGYDPESGFYVHLAPELAKVEIPERPTKAQATAAARLLQDIVRDVPFASDADRAAWLCGLLTPLARPVLGAARVPLFAVDANTAGTGKTMVVAVVIGEIVLGHAMPTASAPADDVEMSKLLTGVALAADSTLLFDNVIDDFGFSSLDKVITSGIHKARLLGGNTIKTLPFDAVVYVTGTNLRFPNGSIGRRVLRARISTTDKHPETRGGFVHGDGLVDYCRKSRARFIVAAHTVLQAYAQLDSARQKEIEGKLSKWGSFPEWNRLVRGAVYYALGVDAAEGRVEFAEQGDTEGNALEQIVAALTTPMPTSICDKAHHNTERARLAAGLTAKELKDYADKSDFENRKWDSPSISPETAEYLAALSGLSNAVDTLGGAGARFSVRTLTNQLGVLTDRSTGKHQLRRVRDRHTKIWRYFAERIEAPKNGRA